MRNADLILALKVLPTDIRKARSYAWFGNNKFRRFSVAPNALSGPLQFRLQKVCRDPRHKSINALSTGLTTNFFLLGFDGVCRDGEKNGNPTLSQQEEPEPLVVSVADRPGDLAWEIS